MDHHALPVDVRNLQGESIRDPEATGVENGAGAQVVEGRDMIENGKALFSAQDKWEPLLSFGFRMM